MENTTENRWKVAVDALQDWNKHDLMQYALEHVVRLYEDDDEMFERDAETLFPSGGE